MTMLIKDLCLQERLIEARKRTDADRWDEVWEGSVRRVAAYSCAFAKREVMDGIKERMPV
jgi:hypothetical protein